MREHYKTDFHRFNLKRKVAGLPPVQENLFLQKLAALDSQKDPVPSKGRQHIKDGKRNKSQKTAVAEEATTLTPFDAEALLSSQRTAMDTSPLPSNSDKPDVKKAEVLDKESESVKSEDELIDEKIANTKPFSLKDSLFDGHRAASFDANLRYMTKTFSFFSPELEFLSDIKGLIRYLGQKISIGNTCIFCNKTYYSKEAVQSHMRDGSHCMIAWEENEEEYLDFYDWSNDPRAQPISEESEEDAEPFHFTEHNELVLASGKILGPRQLKVYYDQRHRARSHQQLVTSLMQEHRRLEAIERQKSTYTPQNTIRRQQNINLKTGLKINNQKHYRNSNPL
jgi:pre-60S factor REI1